MSLLLSTQHPPCNESLSAVVKVVARRCCSRCRVFWLILVWGSAAVILTLIGLFQNAALTTLTTTQHDSYLSYSHSYSDLFSRLSYYMNTTTTTTTGTYISPNTSFTPMMITSTTPSPPNAITTTTTNTTITSTKENQEAGGGGGVLEEEKEEGFSACLIWMDDNPRLVEWIAYHYYMLNLTYLVVGVAPGATTLPHSILHRWRDRITIKVWKLQALNEKENTTNNESNASNSNSNNRMEEFDYTLMDLKEIHRDDPHWQHWDHYIDRQTRFYQTCAFFLKDQNRTWTSFHDVDEYIVLRSGSSSDNSSRGRGTIRRSTENVITNTTRNHSTMIIPPPGIVLQYLQQYNHDHETLSEGEFKATWKFWSIYSACLQIPRALFGIVPSTDAEVMQGVPLELIHQLHNTTTTTSHSSSTSTSITDHPNPNQSVSTAVDFIRQLETLNYRYQITASRPDQLDMDGIPKVVMDVSRLDNPVKVVLGTSPHRPFLRPFCPYPHFWLTEEKSSSSSPQTKNKNTPPLIIPLRIHHYVGSWGLYSYRQNDVRKSGHRNYEGWAAKAYGQDGGVQDAYVRPWLAGLVAHVGGASTAHALLKGAGLPRHYQMSETDTERWAFNQSSGVQWNEHGKAIRPGEDPARNRKRARNKHFK